MGRGRAKAKQTKVARELKYREFNTDFNELQRELHVEQGSTPDDAENYEDDPYADLDEDEARSAGGQ